MESEKTLRGASRQPTHQLIARLAGSATPVRRLHPPAERTIRWLLVSLLYGGGVAIAYELAGGEVRLSADRLYLVQQIAALALAVLGAFYGLSLAVPGANRRLRLLPLLAVAAVWLVAVSATTDSVGSMWDDPGSGLDCMVWSMLLGLGPAIALVAMLRHGAPIHPRQTLMFAALAAAAMGNLGLASFNIAPVSEMTVVLHVVATSILAVLAVLIGPRMLRWPPSGTASAHR